MKSITVTRPFLPNKDDFDKMINEIWNKHWITNSGELHNELEAELKKFLGLDNLHLTVNGHLALETAFTGLELGGEVITTPFTFVSTTNALVRTGSTPVFCDINDDNLTIDVNKIEELITEKTTAIVPVHVYGHPCDVEGIEKIAKKHNLKVVYDAAHAFGVKYKGESICAWGDVSMLSFHATKLFHTIEGGAVVAKNNSPAFEKMGFLRNYGIINEEEIVCIGGNAKMNEFQAAMGIANLKHINEIIAERKNITMAYREQLSSVEGIRFFVPEAAPEVEYNYAYMPILVDEKKFGISRDELYSKLKENNIFARKYFYPLTCDFKCYEQLGKCADVSVARKASSQVLCLPIYNGLELDSVSMICDYIKSAQKVG